MAQAQKKQRSEALSAQPDSSTDLYDRALEKAVLRDGYTKVIERVFNAVSEAAPLKIKRRNNEAYYTEKLVEIRTFFEEEEFQVADALLDMLLELKHGMWRKNGYIPSSGHEIDQLLPLITSLQHGELKEKRADIEKHYGSVEKWICAVICHDIGEDFGVFPSELVKKLRTSLKSKHGRVSEKNEALIQRAARSMERLTHYRKYKYNDPVFLKITGEIDVLERMGGSPGKSGKSVFLKELIPIFQKKMELSDTESENLQVIANWYPGRSKDLTMPRIIVTRYGKSDSDTPQEDLEYGADWPLYIHRLMGSILEEEDPYDALVKINDRIHGLATRIAVHPFNADSFSKYLNDTLLLFEDTSAVEHLKGCIQKDWGQRYGTKISFKDHPLGNTIESLNNMLRAILRIDRLYLGFHPDSNLKGEKGMSVNHVDVLEEHTGFSPILFSPFAPNINTFFKNTDRKSHPIALVMRDLRHARHPDFKPGHKRLYRVIKNGLITEFGDEMDDLLSKPPKHSNVNIEPTRPEASAA